ncbi:hypothetical protein XH97_05600 [Bradyrhizobium sp. CCBAU 53380]|nr:hypothetical protein [Bradyrhizobium sp. CCBAU 53380]
MVAEWAVTLIFRLATDQVKLHAASRDRMQIVERARRIARHVSPILQHVGNDLISRFRPTCSNMVGLVKTFNDDRPAAHCIF